MRSRLSRLPGLMFTIIVLAAILWLTLAPKPMGDDPPPLFPGADKIAHACMFGGLVIAVLFDRQRKNGWKPIRSKFALAVAAASSIFGVAIEFLQLGMHMGRGFEYSDMIADTLGAFICAFAWVIFQKYWLISGIK